MARLPTASIRARCSPDEVEKSISADHTVEVDLTELEDIRRELLRLSGEVARRVRERGWLARTVGIKIRFADFTTVTRVRTLPAWTDVTATIYATAAELYDTLNLDRPRVRLVGVKCENLREADTVGEQLTFDDLFSPAGIEAPNSARKTGDSVPEGEQAQADRGRDAERTTDSVVDAARARFGSGALGYATLLRRPGAPVERRTPAGARQWHRPVTQTQLSIRPIASYARWCYREHQSCRPARIGE